MADRAPEEKHYVEVDLSQDDPRRKTFGPIAPTSVNDDDDEYYADDDEDLGLPSRIYQLDSRTVSDSDSTRGAVTNVINKEIASAFDEGGVATVDDVLSAFKQNLQIGARSRLDVDTESPARDALDAISAAVELAFSERVMEQQPGAGRPRDGAEAKRGVSIRMEPRIRRALTELGLRPQVIADGFADLVDRYNVDDEDASVTLQLLACLFSPAERSHSIAARLAPASIERWRRQQVEKIIARSNEGTRTIQPGPAGSGNVSG